MNSVSVEERNTGDSQNEYEFGERLPPGAWLSSTKYTKTIKYNTIAFSQQSQQEEKHSEPLKVQPQSS